MPSQQGKPPLNWKQRAASRGYLAWKAAGFPPRQQFFAGRNAARNNNNNGQQYQQQQQANFMANMMPQQQGMMMMAPQPFAGMAANQFQNNGNVWGQGQNFGGNMGRNF